MTQQVKPLVGTLACQSVWNGTSLDSHESWRQQTMVVLGSRSPQWREIRLEIWVPGSSLAQPWLLWSKLTKERSLSIPSVYSCVFHTNKQIFKHNHLLSKSVILV